MSQSVKPRFRTFSFSRGEMPPGAVLKAWMSQGSLEKERISRIWRPLDARLVQTEVEVCRLRISLRIQWPALLQRGTIWIKNDENRKSRDRRKTETSPRWRPVSTEFEANQAKPISRAFRAKRFQPILVFRQKLEHPQSISNRPLIRFIAIARLNKPKRAIAA